MGTIKKKTRKPKDGIILNPMVNIAGVHVIGGSLGLAVNDVPFSERLKVVIPISMSGEQLASWKRKHEKDLVKTLVKAVS